MHNTEQLHDDSISQVQPAELSAEDSHLKCAYDTKSQAEFHEKQSHVTWENTMEYKETNKIKYITQTERFLGVL